MEGFFQFIKVEKILNMYWTDSNGWGMIIPLLIYFFVHCTLCNFFLKSPWTTIIVTNIWFVGGEWQTLYTMLFWLKLNMSFKM
jgi:hypothetical protein